MTKDELTLKLVSASKELDHENDEQWTQAGLPDVAVMAKLTGVDSLKRGQIEEALPDFKRRDRPEPGQKKTAAFEIDTDPKPKPKPAATEPMRRFKAVKGVMVRATGRGYYGGEVKEIGDVFRFSGVPGSWMEPA